MSRMKRMLIHITEKQHETLRRLAYEQNRTMSEIVREALDKHLKKPGTDSILVRRKENDSRI